ncbi:MAG: ABC transporter ATP-binding protein [Thermodesulfobacteriota bacterium]|nr:ABC transporter ATP-binding protein [Thermodesulfobacteriota bacterium]
MGIVLKRIFKNYNGRAVLKNLNLEINKGEFHVLLGPSGSGKTTMLLVIAGLIRQDRGSVFIGSRNVSGLAPEKRRIGFVFQDYALFPHLNVFDNVAYGLRIKKVKESKISERVDYYLSKASIEKEKDKFPHHLSGGQKQRVALARALVIEPELLLMDEPMSSLDALTKETIRDELKSIQQEMGTTTVYVTHDQGEAVLLGDRVSVLNHGEIEQIESPDELFYHPKTEFVARFVGAKNILKVRVIEINKHEALAQVNNKGLGQPVKVRIKNYPIFKKGEEINLCIHPEKITLKRENEAPDANLNRIRGKIVNKTNNGNGLKATIDIGGMELHAAVPKNLFDYKIHEDIWVCFSPDALHPLCGKKCRSPGARKKCINGVIKTVDYQLC